MANIIAPILLVVGLAVLFDRLFRPEPRVLSRLVIYLFSPFLILNSMATSDLRAGEMGLIMAMALLSILLVWLIGSALARMFRFGQKQQSVFLLTVVLVNAGNYGLPLNEFAFGRSGLERAVIFYVATSVVANTLGVYLASRGTASIRQSLLNILKVPMPYATALGFLLNISNVSLPLPLERAAGLLGQAAVPVMLIILGLQLSRMSIVTNRFGPVLLATGLRLVIAPLVAFPLVSLLGLPALTGQVSIIQAGMPTAVMAGVLATEFGNDAQFATAVILVSTLASVVTLSVLLQVVGG
jgi:malate permease and related proteins